MSSSRIESIADHVRSCSKVLLRCTSLLLATLIVSRPASATAIADDERESKAPSPKSTGTVYQWKSAAGSPYEYYVPKSYDPKIGANLTAVLHGNGLDYRWTFWNHPPGEFRPDDIVVSLEGTVKLESTGAFEFVAGRESCTAVHAVLEELKALFKVRQTFLYGHSQGSFFVYEFAGEYPKDVDGVVGHAGALWMSSKLAKANHGQAIAFLHGTDDANVPWGQSVAGRSAYRDAGYPLVHLRTLWGWPHAPNWQQAQNELAWCEAMTSDDPARIADAVATLSDSKANGGIDPAALHAAASRLESFAGATSAQKAAATRAKAAVDKCASAIAAAIDKSLGKEKLTKAGGAEWLGMATRFLEDFDGVTACSAWCKAHAAELAAMEKVATDGAREFWQQAEKDPAKAMKSGLELLESGWRNAYILDVLKKVEQFAAGDAAAKLPKKEAARATTLIAAWRKGRESGFEAYAKLLKDLDP